MLSDAVGVVPTSCMSAWGHGTVLMLLGNRLLRWVVGARAAGRSGNKLTAIESIWGCGKGSRGIRGRFRCVECLTVDKACEDGNCIWKREMHVDVRAMCFSKMDCHERNVLVQRSD